MAKFRKIIVSVLMVIVWLVMLVMVVPMTSHRGQFATISICLIINGLLALYYSCIDRRPASFREWLTM